jgi:hypothetical protein
MAKTSAQIKADSIYQDLDTNVLDLVDYFGLTELRTNFQYRTIYETVSRLCDSLGDAALSLDKSYFVHVERLVTYLIQNIDNLSVNPTLVLDFVTSPSIPASLTYSRADTVATYRNSSGELTLGTSNGPRFNYTFAGVALGLLNEGSAVNRCTNHNATPAATTNVSVTGTATVTLVADATALATAKIGNVVTGNVFQASGGASGGTVVIGDAGGTTGHIGATGACSASVYARDVTGSGVSFGITPTPTVKAISGGAYALYQADNMTATATTDRMVFTIPAGVTINFILNQLEVGPFSTTSIKTAGATATRQKDGLVMTLLAANWPGYSQAQGAILVESDRYAPVNATGNAHGAILANGTGLTNCISVYKDTATGALKTRTYDNSVQLYSVNTGSYDKAGQGNLARYTWGFAWRDGSLVTIYNGPSVYWDITLSSSFDAAFNRLDIGSRPFTENIYGHIRAIRFFDKYVNVENAGQYMVQSGDKFFLYTGQSNSSGHFKCPVSGTGQNGGQLAGTIMMDSFWTSTRNWMVDGATEATRIRYQVGDTPDLFWINEQTGDIGNPLARCLRIAAGAMVNGTCMGIMDHSGESDAGGLTQAEYIAAQNAKFERIFLVTGVVPVYIKSLGRNQASDLSTYRTMREFQRALVASNPTRYKLLPEKTDLLMGDTLHMADASYATSVNRDIRFAMNDLGETVSGPVNGPAVSAVSRSGATVTITLTHPSGITDFTPTTGIEGFVFLDNATPVTISAAVRTNATTITLTLASTPSNASQTLHYIYNSMFGVNIANMVKGNDANSLPLQAAKFVSSDTGASFTSSF